jgi:hypothetical protein
MRNDLSLFYDELKLNSRFSGSILEKPLALRWVLHFEYGCYTAVGDGSQSSWSE